MTAVADPLNGTFRADLKLRDVGAPRRIVIDQDTSGVRLDVTLNEPGDVRAWAAQMGVETQVHEPHQNTPRGWWYQHTTATLKRDGLEIRVGSVEIAEDREMTKSVKKVTAP